MNESVRFFSEVLNLIKLGVQIIWYNYNSNIKDEPDCGHGEILTILERLISVKQDYEEDDNNQTKIIKSSCPEIPSVYKSWVERQTRQMNIDKLVSRGEVISVGLPSVYIQLYCDDFLKKKTYSEYIENLREGSVALESPERKPVNIETLISTVPILLLEAPAGSGKTTILRHLARSIIEGTAPSNLNGFLPVLIFLKDLNALRSKITGMGEGMACAETLLSNLFQLKGNGLDQSILEEYCKSEKVIFLLDGLDELDEEEYQNIILESFFAIRDNYPNIKIVLTTRSYSVSIASKYFNDYYRKIHPLANGQIKLFINKWYEHIVGGDGFKKAEELITEIRRQPEIQELKSNPLMLTAICILYWHSNQLPEQRADLFNRIVGNLLQKRFRWSIGETQGLHLDEYVDEFLCDLSYTMKKNRWREIDRAKAIKILAKIFPQKEDENSQDYNRRKEHLFEKIQKNCGLLHQREGGYAFDFPIFQDFFAARYLMTLTNFEKFILDVIDDIWWHETIRFFIDTLSIGSKGLANKIIDTVFAHPVLTEDATVKRMLIIASAFRDISPPKRIPTTTEKVQNSLLAIMTGNHSSKLKLEAGELLGWIGDPRDLTEFASILGGEYPFGDAGEKIHIGSFEISKYPVTNRWFQEFIEDDGYNYSRPWWLVKILGDVKLPRYWEELEWTCQNFPVVGVSWYEANAFVNWLNFNSKDYYYKLPTEFEWMAAAAGKDGKKYIWGEELNSKDHDLCNFGSEQKIGANLGRTSPVGMFPKGNTPEEISDLIGNVWEWCEESYINRDNARVMKGGGFYNRAEFCNSFFRSYAYEKDRYPDLSFRVIRFPKEEKDNRINNNDFAHNEKKNTHSQQYLTDEATKPTIGIITALPKEYTAMKILLDNQRDFNVPGKGAGRRYCIGDVLTTSGSKHTLVLSLADMGNNIAAMRASLLLEHFPNVESIIMVGIAGGAPNDKKAEDHVRVGDIVISNYKGVVQYDFIKEEIKEVEHRHPPRPPKAGLLEAVRYLEAAEIEGNCPWLKFIDQAMNQLRVKRPSEEKDILYSSTDSKEEINHPYDEKRKKGEPRVFIAAIASANILLKNSIKRDELRDKFGIKAVEMEGSGISDATWNHEVGYLIIRGICDYCDENKNDIWQEYAAIVAAAYTRALIESIP